MRIESGFGEYFKYSLYDARILKIEHINDNLILYFDYIFSHNEDRSENTHKAKIIFEKVDIDGKSRYRWCRFSSIWWHNKRKVFRAFI